LQCEVFHRERALALQARSGRAEQGMQQMKHWPRAA
jgi:hypothetical protein